MADKKTNSNSDLKKSGIAKLQKLGKTTSEAHISFALRQGKITKQEAAAIDPKNFKILLEPVKVSKSITVDLKSGKSTINSSRRPRGGAGGAGLNISDVK